MTTFMTAADAVSLIRDGDTVALLGNGGGVLEPATVHRAIEDAFLTTDHPRALTVYHSAGIGDRDAGGLSRFAHAGLVKRVVGGHWGWSPRMQALANAGAIEAYNLPQGVIVSQYREIAARRPGLITKTGLGTYVDPRLSGGKLNDATTDDLVSLIELNGEQWLHYPASPINVGIIRGTSADERGNISFEEEPCFLEALALAQAAHNSGGTVIAQVKYRAEHGALHPQAVQVPGYLVDAVVVEPGQWQTTQGPFDPALAGSLRRPVGEVTPLPLGHRKVVARRAAMLLEPGSIINLGFGMPDGVASVAAEEGTLAGVTMTIEQGLSGGMPAGGDIFGTAYNADVFLDAPAQFDFYSGRGLDLTCLGLAQADAHGNVNVSKFGPTIAGCGGFIDISQSAKTIVFCGTFTAGGLTTEIRDGELRILTEGRARKFPPQVEHVTFSGDQARALGQDVWYVTERAVFHLEDAGLTLVEIAPGIDLQTQVLDLMDFTPTLADELTLMDARIYRDAPMNLGRN